MSEQRLERVAPVARGGKPSPTDRAREVADQLRALEAQHETQ